MRYLILLIAMGVIGVIGTVEYSHAVEFREINLPEILEKCKKTGNTEQITTVNLHDHVILNNTSDSEYYLYIFNSLTQEYQEIRIKPDKYHYWVPSHTASFSHLGEHILGLPYGHQENCEINNMWPYQLSKFRVVYNEHQQNDEMINLIARTFNLTPNNQPTQERTQEPPSDIWQERYNTCFDKKENFKTELSELQSIYNILQSDNTELNSQLSIYYQNLTNANFEIDKLKKEKAELIKKVETLETQLSEN